MLPRHKARLVALILLALGITFWLGISTFLLLFSPLAVDVKATTNRSVFVAQKQRRFYNFTVGFCVLVKDADAYLEEWIDYHLWGISIDHIYVYDNSDTFDLKTWDINKKATLQAGKRVVIHHYPTPNGTVMGHSSSDLQRNAYLDCMKRYAGPNQMDYMALIDVDEFFVIQNTSKYRSIHDVLLDYLIPFSETAGALVINTISFGTANRTVYTPEPVTKRFKYRQAEPHSNIKSIVATKAFRQVKNPHAVALQPGKTVLTTQYPGCIHATANTLQDNFQDFERPSKVMLLYHYRTLSLQEYIAKRCVRGTIHANWCTADRSGIRTDAPPHIQSFAGDVYDDKAWKCLVRHVPEKYNGYDA